MANNKNIAKLQKGNVRIENLVKKFGDTVAVNDVSLDIQHGEFLTLLGPSGSGKTTVLMMIAGFQVPTEGMIYIGDEPIITKPPNKRNIGMVFQHYALFPHKTIFENIAFPLKMRKTSKKEIAERVHDALSLVKLPDYWNRYPKQLSGGQQQRIALARALVFNPAVLLMDEPLGALDKKLRDHMQIEIKNLVEKLNITVIYVTHDQQEALTMSDRIAVLNQGRLEQIGPPEHIYENPANWFVADFIGESNLLEGIVNVIGEDTCSIGLSKGLEFKAFRTEGISLNEKVKFTIRPEKIFFASGKEEFVNICEGIIDEIIYVGNIAKYRLKLTNGDYSLTLNQPTHSRMNKYEKADKVKIYWYPEDAKIVS
jgi:spermidine/putrescine ABC transporter ATP-binding subunit